MHSIPVFSFSNRKQERWGISIFASGFIGLGTLLAEETIPSDIGRADALFLPALCMTLSLLIPVALQVRFNLLVVLRVENLLMLGIVYWLLLDMLQSAYLFQYVTGENVQEAFGMVGAFAAAVWLGAAGRGWPLPRVVAATATRTIPTTALYTAALISFALGMSKFAIACDFNPVLMIESLAMDRWSAPWSRGDIGGVDSLLDHMQYFGYIVPSICVLIAIRVGWLNARVISSLFLSAIVVAFLAQSGGRRIIGVVIGSAIFTWIAAKPRLGPKVILGGVAVSLSLLLFMQEMLRYRNVGFGAWWSGDRPDLFVDYIHVDDNFLRLAQLTYFYPNIVEYAFYQPLFHAITLPIPRILWPGKPTGPGFDLSWLLGYEGVSLSCSIIGELYVSYGIGAVMAGGWIMGRIAAMWNKILLLPAGAGRPLMYGLGVMTLFTGLRSIQAFVQMSYIVLAWIAVANFLPKLNSKKI